MHANRAYWGGGFALASTTVQITSGAVAISNTALASGTACTTAGSTACNYTQMAAYDHDPATKRIVYVIINFDDSLHQYWKEYRAQIDEFMANNPSDLVVEFDIKPAFYSAMA